MKTIDLATTATTLSEVLDLAGRQNVLVRTPDGREFVVVEIEDDFANEVGAVGRNVALTRLLAERSAETTRVSLDDVKRQLQVE